VVATSWQGVVSLAQDGRPLTPSMGVSPQPYRCPRSAARRPHPRYCRLRVWGNVEGGTAVAASNAGCVSDGRKTGAVVTAALVLMGLGAASPGAFAPGYAVCPRWLGRSRNRRLRQRRSGSRRRCRERAEGRHGGGGGRD